MKGQNRLRKEPPCSWVWPVWQGSSGKTSPSNLLTCKTALIQTIPCKAAALPILTLRPETPLLGCNCILESFQPKHSFVLNTFLQISSHTMDYWRKSTKTQSALKKLLPEYAFQHRGHCLMAGCGQSQLQQLWTNTKSYFSPCSWHPLKLLIFLPCMSTLSNWEKWVCNWTSARRHASRSFNKLNG